MQALVYNRSIIYYAMYWKTSWYKVQLAFIL